MEHAAIAVGKSTLRAFVLEKASKRAQALLIVAGSGNNGGDALAVARFLLWNHGAKDLTVVSLGSPKSLSKSSALQLNALHKLGVPVTDNIPNDLDPLWAIDGIFGTGPQSPGGRDFSQSDRGPQLHSNFAGELRSDIPSGLSTDTGQGLGGCRAGKSYSHPWIHGNRVWSQDWLPDYVGNSHARPHSNSSGRLPGSNRPPFSCRSRCESQPSFPSHHSGRQGNVRTRLPFCGRAQ